MSEIMAPAGSLEQLTASVRSGADRVYFGCGKLNARRKSGDLPSIREVVEYCHKRGVKATAALNIILQDKELPIATELIKEVARCGCDGIIVQDLAVAKLVKEICPDLPLHASTQMSIHNISGVKMLEKLGFKRVVLARELSFEEIKNIRNSTDLELEVFVHGALCMSVSGMCQLSSFWGSRSGNRGLCAQPCRLDFKSEKRDFALSLKDLSLLDHIQDLVSIGIDSFKIEGRMKRPEYAAAVVSALSSAIKGTHYDKKSLQSVFSRDGFTDGYFVSRRDATMFGHRTKKDTENTNQELRRYSDLYRNENQRIPVRMNFTAKMGVPISLKIESNDAVVFESGDVPDTAITRPLDKQTVTSYLNKCGGTPYFASEIICSIDDGLSLPISKIKSLRRKAFETLDAERLKKDIREINDFSVTIPEKHIVDEPPKRYVIASKFEQIELIENADRYFLTSSELLKYREKISDKFYAVFPALNFIDDTLDNQLKQLKHIGVKGVLVNNIGLILPSLKYGFKIIGGTGLNITNSLSMDFCASLNIDEIICSPELPFAAVKEMGGKIKRGIISYGNLPMMYMRTCPLRTKQGCSDCKGSGILIDRKNQKWQLSCDNRQYTVLYNPIPLYLGHKDTSGVDFTVLYFTDESQKRCKKIYDLFTGSYNFDGNFTTGHYNKSLL